MAATKRRRTKGAGGVFRDKAGKWHFRTEITADPGTGRRRIIETTGLVKSDARQRHENKLREYERTGIIHSNQSPYLRDYIIRWCGQRRRDLKPNTWYNLDKRCNIIANIIGGVRLAELTPAHVRLMMDRLGRTRAPRTVREYHGILKQALDDAELEELIDRNPCRRVKPPRYEETPQRILDESQPKELIAAAVKAPMAGGRRGPHDSPEDTEMWAILFELAFATGMREGERYALMPYELEQRDGVPGINVQQQIQQYGKPEDAVIPAWLKAEHLYGILWLTTPKTHAAHRFVPISTSLWQRLWARIKRLDIGPRDLIFTNSRGNPVRSSTERYNWNKALKAAGLPPVTIHSARHWTASMTARANMPDDARTAIMGHTSISVTNHYTHRDAASLAALLDRAIPDLHDERDVIDAQVIEEGK